MKNKNTILFKLESSTLFIDNDIPSLSVMMLCPTFERVTLEIAKYFVLLTTKLFTVPMREKFY